jgi:hypothetical protein
LNAEDNFTHFYFWVRLMKYLQLGIKEDLETSNLVTQRPLS